MVVFVQAITNCLGGARRVNLETTTKPSVSIADPMAVVMRIARTTLFPAATRGARHVKQQSYEISEEFVPRHARQLTFQKSDRAFVVRSDAGEVKVGTGIFLLAPEILVPSPQDVEAARHLRIESQAAQVADPAGLAVHEAL